MPLPHFLALIFVVILAAGASLLAVQTLGLSPVWLGLGALVMAAAMRGLAWR